MDPPISADAIDIHAHVTVPEATEFVRPHLDAFKDPFLRFGGVSTAYNERLAPDLKGWLTDPAKRLARMDRQGIRRQVISIAPAHYYYWASPELGAAVARIQNDSIAETVAAHPDRLTGLASLPMQAPVLAVEELRRAVTSLGLAGVSINPSAEGRDYDDPEYEPFWEAAEELDALVLLHPNGVHEGSRLTKYYMINVVGNPMETTIALSHLILGGVLERHPAAKILAVHGGGYLPFYMDRMDHAYEARSDVSACITRPPSTYAKQLFFDSVVFGDGLERLVRLVGADHVVMGTDYPFDMGDDDPIGRIGSLAALSSNDRASIFGDNARRLLRRDAPQEAAREPASVTAGPSTR